MSRSYLGHGSSWQVSSGSLASLVDMGLVTGPWLEYHGWSGSGRSNVDEQRISGVRSGMASGTKLSRAPVPSVQPATMRFKDEACKLLGASTTTVALDVEKFHDSNTVPDLAGPD